MSVTGTGDTTCYCKHQEVVVAGIDGACGVPFPCKSPKNGEIVQCCRSGSACGSNGFCFQNDPQTTNNSGYYLASCTDPNFKDPACPQPCTDQLTQDVVWVNAQHAWACCRTNDSNNCGQPSGETFTAPAPYELSFDSAATSAAQSTLSAATSAASTPAASSTAPVGSGPGLSAVPVSSIVLATVAGVLVLLAAGALFIFWRERKKRKALAIEAGFLPGTEVANSFEIRRGNVMRPMVEAGRQSPAEMDARR